MGNVYPSRWRYRNKVVTKVYEYVDEVPMDKAIGWEILYFASSNIIFVVPASHIVTHYYHRRPALPFKDAIFCKLRVTII